MSSPLDRIATLAATPEGEIDLARSALTIALLEYPDLDFGPSLERLDELSAAARPFVERAGSLAERLEALSVFVHQSAGFRGNQADYYDPRNSFLNDVLDRRTGIPITLALVYCELGRRLGVPLVGVGFPGHFLVKHPGSGELFLDPFSGRRLDRADRQRLFDAVTGETRALEDRWLRAASAREVLVRMLRNLKLAWLRQKDAAHALDAASAILLFHPDDPAELRDRGVLYLQLECFAAALQDLEQFLLRSPQDPSADRVLALLPDLRRRVASLQ